MWRNVHSEHHEHSHRSQYVYHLNSVLGHYLHVQLVGLCLPGSSSNPAESPAKMRECAKAAEAIKICMEKNIRPRDLLTKESFENALVMTMALG